jgi:hypothetical protein
MYAKGVEIPKEWMTPIFPLGFGIPWQPLMTKQIAVSLIQLSLSFGILHSLSYTLSVLINLSFMLSALYGLLDLHKAKLNQSLHDYP